jgi:hypothetical protein
MGKGVNIEQARAFALACSKKEILFLEAEAEILSEGTQP